MEIILIACFVNLLNIVNCYSDSESVESNRIEVSPFYDTIIYGDIADIFNDFETNGISPFDMFANSESQSTERIEDLLTEYQHRLEKAHKQRKKYIEKSKNKNKVPPLPHEQFSKTKPSELKNNDLYFSNGFYNPGVFKLPHPAFGHPLDLFIPLNSKAKYLQKLEMTTNVPKLSRGDILPMEKIIFDDKKILTLPPVMHNPPSDPIQSTCFCKSEVLPCECKCKHCLVHIGPIPLEPQMKMRSQEGQKKPDLYPALFNNSLKKYEQGIDDNMKNLNDNTFNIHIKVDLQLPKVHENLGTNYNHIRARPFESEGGFSKEFTTAIKLPFPYLGMPGSMDFFNFNKPTKYNKDEPTPMHKLVMHKKKKSRSNNNNKKHRKKIITIHNIKLEQQPLLPLHFDDKNSNRSETNYSTIIQPSNNKIMQPKTNLKINATTDTLNDTYKEDNTSKNVSNATEASYKFENSIEIDFTKNNSNLTTELPTIRKRRDLSNVNISINESNDDTLLVKSLDKKAIMTQDQNNVKKSDKTVLSDAELLYWPAASKQETFHNRNITSIILENEHKRTKLNMSKETIRQNHTKALEQAIFGDVNWDDIDTVAPTFMSFIGKYVQGILTFCSEQICHSMNCANKTCLHRVCVPTERLNNKGHCAGSNNTDSVASMESIMDLPSNIVFEVVDILQSKMLGKVFGKATFCINSKCITLAASKKIFVKSRCVIKELTAGHCSSTKTLKIM